MFDDCRRFEVTDNNGRTAGFFYHNGRLEFFVACPAIDLDAWADAKTLGDRLSELFRPEAERRWLHWLARDGDTAARAALEAHDAATVLKPLLNTALTVHTLRNA